MLKFNETFKGGVQQKLNSVRKWKICYSIDKIVVREFDDLFNI